MSLATRCTSCGTAFRVIQDQLQVSEGWVRCGRCSEVFNALEGLFDLEREAAGEMSSPAHLPAAAVLREPPAAALDSESTPDRDDRPGAALSERIESQGARDGGGASAEHQHEHEHEHDHEHEHVREHHDRDREYGDDSHGEARPGRDDHAAAALAGAADDDRDDDHWKPGPFEPTAPELESGRLLLRPAFSASGTAPSAEARAADDASALDAEIDAHLFGAHHAARRRPHPSGLDERDRLDFSDARFDSDLLADAADEGVPAIDSGLASVSTDFPLETASAPDFVRRAEREARWQRPRVRAGLAIAGLLLGAMLVVQVFHHFRDIAAARWPAARPMLAGWCAMLSCTIEAPRRIDEVSVESTALVRVPGLDAFRLALSVRSRGSVAIAMPWVDLTLTDSTGKLVARKALAASQFEPPTSVLQPGAEVALQALLNTGQARVTGYTVEIFYP